MCWETVTYPRLLMGLGSVRGRNFTFSPKVKGILYGTFVIALLFFTLLTMFFGSTYILYRGADKSLARPD